ncbi:RRQRL motif-containing zinc-binding protein [Longispora sp. NPDC051575]|uniref:RRQRL motif-containing zinc-binding protein n=1 Tax=Longispora sp. NPDC051575 TaxID=3154943 RepID=UPI003445B53B
MGIPVYRFNLAPSGLATVRQLRSLGLRPGGQDVVGEISWRKGRRVAYLYDITKALPKRQATPAQLAAIGRALLARRTCSTCGEVKEYYIPRRYGECLGCSGVSA